MINSKIVTTVTKFNTDLFKTNYLNWYFVYFLTYLNAFEKKKTGSKFPKLFSGSVADKLKLAFCL